MASNNNNNLPAPESYEQILADALSAYAAKIGINDFNVGSTVTSFYEVVALIAARSSGDLFQILRDFSIDRATGDALQRLATENGVTPVTASPATGNVIVSDSSFVKISTAIYAGSNPPNIGSITVDVSNASNFPASGAIYIGRGTPNIEGPISYAVPPVQVGNFWRITLLTPTTKFHNLGESVILSQGGNRSVPTGTMVLAPAVGANPDIQYSVTASAIILDGETSVDNVLVTALLPGSSGNVPIGAIKTFASPPFSGAVVSNILPFTTGLDNETDDKLRDRIKAQLASTGLGTSTAVKAAVNGATSPNAQSSIVSSEIVLRTNGSAILYIDNGSGYEAQSQGVGLESIVDSAIGGEQFFQLATGGSQAPVAKAFLQTTLSVPFDLRQGDTLAVDVGGVIYQHVFQDSDFINPGGATVYEITASINGDTTLGFEATTAGGGQFVVIRAKAEVNDSIKIAIPTTSGRDAAIQMGFPSSLAQTLRLYKNDFPLNKDGEVAALFSQNQSLWSNTIQDGETLILQVDNTGPITYTISDADFVATELYTSVSAGNSLVAWQEVLQNKLTGVTVSISGQQIEIVSNLLANDRAQLSIDPSSTLVTKGMFSSTIGLSSVGMSSDYTLSRNTAQFELVVPLVAGDKLSAGSIETTARIESAIITGASVTFPAEAYFWLLSDSPGELIHTGISGNTVLAVSKPSTNIVRYTTSVPSAFSGVLPGDYLIIWSPELNSNNRLEGRVHASTSTTIDILITAAEYAAAVPESVVFIDGFVVLRSTKVPRKFSLPIGTSSLDQIAALLQAQTDQILFTVHKEESLIIRSATTDLSGYLLIVTADNNGKLLNLPVGTSSFSQTSLIAFNDSKSFDGKMPLFLQNTFSAGSFANPPDSFISSVTSSVSLSSFDPNDLIAFLHPYGAIRDEQPYGELDQMSSISGSVIGLAPQPLVRRVRISDRYFVANPLDFGQNDNFTVILDSDPVTNSFSIPVYRRAIANTSQTLNPNNFNAYDVDAGAAAQFNTNFGSFDFSNFKALMQAKKVLKTQAAQTGILYRASRWGRSGELITIAYTYPPVPNASIGSTIQVGETTDIRIGLKSGAAIVTSISPTTQWNVTVTPNTPVAGIDQVTYTWNTVGTNPALTLSGGEYVNITNQTAFNLANTGVFRVSTQGGFTPTATSFSVQRPNGFAVVESNKATLVNGAIIFYASSPTTAAQVQAYVAANLIDITATLVNDGGTSGSGVITFSTYEDGNFSSQTIQLLDGINWIFSSNLGGTPQFTFKKPLSYSAAGPANAWYQFNALAYGVTIPATGEEVRLIPTTIEQVKNLISVLAVTGFTTLGNVSVVERGSKFEISTITLGSDGSVQVIGGYANGYQVPILDSAVRIDNTIMSVSVNSVASAGVLSDQWFRLQASKPQIKDALFSSNTDIDIVGNSPISGESTVKLSNRSLDQRNFGRPRSYIRSLGDTFRIEKQGSLVCLSWNGVGTSPHFLKSSLNFNDSGGGTVTVNNILNSDNTTYTILSGNANFTELSIGDYLTISGMVNPENDGTFLVTGVSDNGKIVQVLNAVAKNEVATVFVSGNFTASSSVSEGDTLILSSPFNVLNRGQFRVIRRYNDSVWFENDNAFEEEVTLSSNLISLGYSGTTTFSVVATNNILHLQYGGTGTVPTLSNAQVGDIVTLGTDFNAANRGSFMVTKSGNNFLEAINPSAVSESGIIITNVLTVHRPQMQFYEYEATVPGDRFVVTGNVLGANNVGSYIIDRVVDRDTAIVVGSMVTVSGANLTGAETSVFVQEGLPYFGYKQVRLINSQPGTTDRNTIVFTTNAQYEKINESSGTQMVSLNKLDFSTVLINGLDSYRFNTDLIQIANKIIYGDPTNSTTYPGVGAAGAEIFVQEPLTLRIKLSIDVRLKTGVPFSASVQQIRSTVGALINSNPVGKSISFSSIIGAVTAIPGVVSVVIASPLYNVTHDLIVVDPSEKTRVIDPTVDISVAQIGN